MQQHESGFAQPGSPASSPVKAPLAKAYCQISVNGAIHATETDYVPHVIACENGGANFEALKAQAIAARSVAYYEMANDGSICDGQGCQVYTCGAAPQKIHYDAATATAGQYLSYNGWLTYSFYVDGDHTPDLGTCKGMVGGSNEQYITYNDGKTGTGVKQTTLGFVFAPGDVGYGQNRGCMSQWGARCLENEKGWLSAAILRFYYGADIQILQAQGPCVTPPKPPVSKSIDRDYNGDGTDDIFWYTPGDAVDPLWLGAQSGQFTKTSAPNVGAQYLAVPGDFNGDGRSDVLFYAAGAQAEALWNGTAAGSFIKSTPKDAQGVVMAVNGDYTPIAGNFNGDAYSDVLFYAPGATQDYIWFGLGGNKFKSLPLSVGGDYYPVAGDFDGDTRTDILWYIADNLPEPVWYGRPSTVTPFDKLTTTSLSSLYQPFAGDFNADGRDDIFLYGPGAKADNLWNGTAARGFIHTQPLQTNGTPWSLGGIYEPVPGDFNGDGATDVLWYGPGGDLDYLWFATSGNRFTSQPITIGGTYTPI